jgi:hypothetical protein
MTHHPTTPAAHRKSLTHRKSLRSAAVALAAVAIVGGLTGCNASSAAGGGSKAPYTDAEACAWLTENLPTVQGIMAQAQLAMGLSVFFEEHGGLAHADAYALDDAFSRGCADLHAQALKQAEIKTFGDL